MGATSIDAATVRGLLGELGKEKQRSAENEGAFQCWRRRCIEDEAAALEVVSNLVASLSAMGVDDGVLRPAREWMSNKGRA